MSYPLQPGEPGYHDSQYAVDQARQMERDAAWVDHFRFHEATDPEVIASQQQRIRALEECLADFERDFGCDHVTDESACCNSCHARRLLSQRVRVLPSRRG